jgi:hypothetical protein
VRRVTVLLVVACACVALVECRSPTEVVVLLTTDVPCPSVTETSIAAGAPGAVGTTPGATTPGCNADGIGTIVLVPSDGKGDPFGIEVVTAVGVPLDTCSAEHVGPQCIVARRKMAFIPHTPLTLPIAMRAACLGKTCDPDSTCVAGRCVSAYVDPEGCTAPGGCDESTLAKLDAGATDASSEAGEAGGGDASGDAPADAFIDDATPDAFLPYGATCTGSGECVGRCCCSYDLVSGSCDNRSGCTRLGGGSCL